MEQLTLKLPGTFIEISDNEMEYFDGCALNGWEIAGIVTGGILLQH